MTLRTGMLRVGKVIRGLGLLAGAGVLLVGLASGVSEGWQYPASPLLSDAQVGLQPPSDGPWTKYRSDPLVNAKTANEKEFSLGNVKPLHALVGLILGAALVGVAFVLAWVVEGFAPER